MLGIGKRKPLRVLIAFPRYRFLWACAEDFECDLLMAAFTSEGRFAVGRIPADGLTGLHVERAREMACLYAVEKNFDVVLMGDADAGCDGADGLELARAAAEGGFGILAAPVARRGADDAPNFAPWEKDDREQQAPTTEEVRALADAVRNRAVYVQPRGYVATTISAFAVEALRKIPRPWFHRPLEHDDGERRGITGRTTEDVFYCRRARDAGQPVGVHFGIRSAVHWDAAPRKSDRMLESMTRTLDAMLRAGRTAG